MEESGPLSLSLAIRYTATVKDSFCNSLNPRPRGAIFYYFARCPVMRQFLSDRSFVHAYLTLLTLCLFFLFFFYFVPPPPPPHFAFNPFSLSLYLPLSHVCSFFYLILSSPSFSIFLLHRDQSFFFFFFVNEKGSSG